MPLPHFTQLQMTGSPGGPGTQPQEIVYLNLFEVTFILPTILQAQGRDPILLLQQATKVSDNADLTQDIGGKEQYFKYSTRYFLTTPKSTHLDNLTIDFNANVNDQGSMETYNTLRAWYDLVWNSQNGSLHYKSDIIGTIIVNLHDKKGVVLRRITYQNCQLKKLTGYALDWTAQNVWDNLQATFAVDYWVDEYIDNNFTISPPLISGY